jgi:arylsulfatase A-like enzyme
MGMTKTVLLVLASIALAILLLSWGGFRAEMVQAETRPNIIFVMSNDQDAATLEKMPYVGGPFQNEATTFPNATYNFSLCCPSRTSILRGQYTHNHGVWKNTAEEGGGYEKFLANGLDNSNFPLWLDRAGYNTGGFGLYINQYDPAIHGTPAGFDFFRFYSRDWNNQQVPNSKHRDRYVKDNAVRWLEENLPGGPLTMWVSFNAPHSPYTYDPAYIDRFTDEELPKPPSFNEGDVSDKPSYFSNWPSMTDAEITQLELDYRDRLRGLLTIDAAMQTMVERLREAGELDNTYIVYWSDNGYMMGQHRLKFKQHPYTESISFPMLVRGPGVVKGAIDPRIVMNQDLAPTFADLADTPVPKFVDGRSMVPIFDGAGTWRDVGMIEAPDPSTLIDPTSYRGIRDEDYTYVEYSTGEREYYDLRTDPYQLENGYGALTDERKAELAARLDALKGCARSVCREAEGDAPPWVERVVPEENAILIDPVANLRVFFSEAMRTRSVNANTVQLSEKGLGVPLAAQVSYEAATKRAILNPDADLVVGKSYRATVTTRVRDEAGNRLDQDPVVAGDQRKIWFFTVRK